MLSKVVHSFVLSVDRFLNFLQQQWKQLEEQHVHHQVFFWVVLILLLNEQLLMFLCNKKIHSIMINWNTKKIKIRVMVQMNYYTVLQISEASLIQSKTEFQSFPIIFNIFAFSSKNLTLKFIINKINYESNLAWKANNFFCLQKSIE